MANYMSSCRSNYFKIGRPLEFMEWIGQFPDVVFEERRGPDSPQDMYGMVYVDNPDGAGWPCWRFDEDDNEIEVDFFQDFAEFLAPDEVAVFMEVGAEKLRYLYGVAIAVHSNGETISVSLTDIMDKCFDQWAIQPTDCTY